MVSGPTLGDLEKAETEAKERGGFCCVVCKFFIRQEPTDVVGECRRNAPVSSDTYGRGLWPGVEIVDWCGQGAKR